MALAAACARTPAPTPAAVALSPVHYPVLEGRGELLVPAGTPMVVNVWATWCEPCRREMASLERLHAQVAASGVRVVGISVDSDRHLAAEFVRAQRLTFPNGIDTAGARVAGELGVTKFPTTLVIDAAGVVRWKEEAARDWSDAATVARVLAQAGAAR